MITLDNVLGGYNEENHIGPININFLKGSISIIVGPNGCGKSTLIKIIARQLPFNKGNIILDDKNLKLYKSKELAKKISYLPQTRALSNIDVKSLVLHGRFPHLGYPRRYQKLDMKIANEAMELTEVSHLKNQLMSTISGGERQKVYLAMLLAQGGEVILMDEPTTFLDISHQIEVMNIILSLKKQNKTLIVVLHDINMALRYADYIFVMNNGKLEFNGKSEDVFEKHVLDRVFNVSMNRYYTKNDGIQYYIS